MYKKIQYEIYLYNLYEIMYIINMYIIEKQIIMKYFYFSLLSLCNLENSLN